MARRMTQRLRPVGALAPTLAAPTGGDQRSSAAGAPLVGALAPTLAAPTGGDQRSSAAGAPFRPDEAQPGASPHDEPPRGERVLAPLVLSAFLLVLSAATLSHLMQDDLQRIEARSGSQPVPIIASPLDGPSTEHGPAASPDPSSRSGPGGGTGLAVLYRPARPDSPYLQARVLELAGASLAHQVDHVVSLLGHPGEAGEPAVLPACTRVLAIFFDEGALTVSLSRDVLDPGRPTVERSRLLIYALVNTLASLPQVERIRLLVDNRERETLNSHMDTSGWLLPRRDLVEGDA